MCHRQDESTRDFVVILESAQNDPVARGVMVGCIYSLNVALNSWIRSKLNWIIGGKVARGIESTLGH